MIIKDKVYELLRTIPKGKVLTYGQIGSCLGNKNLARVVGNILHNNPEPITTPCHRVVNAKGEVAAKFGFGGGEVQRRLLEEEGIVFELNGRIDLKKYGMDPRKCEFDSRSVEMKLDKVKEKFL